jgi:filamentous hemagglutinin family protein
MKKALFKTLSGTLSRLSSLDRMARCKLHHATQLDPNIMAGNSCARRTSRRLQLIAMAIFSALNAGVNAAPSGGQIVAGSGSISGTYASTTIQQNSNLLAIDWKSFSTTPTESITFRQPNADSIVLNRVVGSNPSILLGRLDANGQVFIINSAGVLFGATSQVNVGGLIASTLDLSNSDFLSGHYAFSDGDPHGWIVNEGVIRATQGGYVALIGAQVSNDGVLLTPGGFAALAAGSRVTVTLGDHQMVGLSVDQGVLHALAANHGLILADGGQAWLVASAEDALLDAVVNNTGVIRARSAVDQGGVIRLLADDGTVEVGGILDASAPAGGNGGLIETAGAQVHVMPGAVVTTAASSGQTGEWLIGADSFTIAKRGGDITGEALSQYLDQNNVTIAATSPQAGTISLDDALAWNISSTLSMFATNAIALNGPITAPAGVLVLGAGSTGTQSAPIAVSQLALLGNGQFQLDNASNQIGTLAANTGSIDLVDGAALSVGTVGNVTGIATTGATTLSAPALTLDSPVSSAATGTAVTLASATSFTNDAGANAVSTPNGRWLIYSGGPDADTFDGLQSGNLALWGDTYATSADDRAAAASGNRYVFTVQQQAVLSADTLDKTAGTALTLGPDDVSLVLRYVGASYDNAFTDGSGAHAPLSFTVTSAGASADAAVGDYAINVVASGPWPVGYTVITQPGTLHVVAATQTVPPPPPDQPPPASTPTPSYGIVDSAQTVAAETEDERTLDAIIQASTISPRATPVIVEASDDPATDGKHLPSDAWPGHECRR